MNSQFNPTGKPAKFTEGQQVRNIVKGSYRYGWVGTVKHVQQWLLGYDIDYGEYDTHRPISGDYPYIAEAEESLEAVTTMNINEARATDLTDTNGAAAILKCSIETIRQLVIKKQLRCFCFVDGVLTEGNAKGRSAIFLRQDIKALPPRVHGWPAGKARKKAK